MIDRKRTRLFGSRILMGIVLGLTASIAAPQEPTQEPLQEPIQEPSGSSTDRGRPRTDDVVTDVESTDAPATMTAEADTYTVQAGDTLMSIARAHYNDESMYLTIFEANRTVLESPDDLKVGQVLSLPKVASEPAPMPAAELTAD